jgi:hydrocephalus-inducing protein
LQIINGPAYVLALNGSGYKPKLNLSFLSYDFGPCHVFQQGMTPAVAKLVIVNEDRQPVSFDAVFDNTDNWQVGVGCVEMEDRRPTCEACMRPHVP